MARRTCFREQYYTGTRNSYSAGKIGASDHVKLYVNLCRFFLVFSGFPSSFGLSSFVVRDMFSPDQGSPVQCLGKSMGKSSTQVKVILDMVMLTEFRTRGLLRSPNDAPKTQERALTRNELHIWLEELASESNPIQAQGILTRQERLELQAR